MSDLLAGIEKQFNEVFVEKAPYQLPKKAKEWIIQYIPIIGLIFGVLGLLATLGLWRSAHVVNNLVDYSNQLSRYYGTGQTVHGLGFSFYATLIALLATSVLPILAYSGLKAGSKSRGWNLLFYGDIVSLVYGVFNAVYQGGIFGLISTLIGSAIGFYFLFQIRSHYTQKASD